MYKVEFIAAGIKKDHSLVDRLLPEDLALLILQNLPDEEESESEREDYG